MCDRCASAAPTKIVRVAYWPSRRERVMELCAACVAVLRMAGNFKGER
jgi:hypothetical protein